MNLLTVNNLTLLKGHNVIVRRFSLTLAAGDIVHLTGDNGSGKTTLLQALAGLHPYPSGKITATAPWLYLGHRAGVKGTLTVRENIRFAAQLYHHMTHEGLETRLQEALAAMGLTAQADRQTRFLSAGQQRRTQLARLWLDTPPLWLLDEPLTALDVATTTRLLAQIAAHQAAGGAVIITSHQPLALPTEKVVALTR